MRIRSPSRATARRAIAGINTRILLSLVWLCAVISPRPGQAQRILCSGGFGYFSSEFQESNAAVTVIVRASKHGGFASHTCDATLRWGDTVLPAVQGAWQVDIDVLGADLALGGPIVSFQFKKSDVDKLMTYQIYSLKRPPHLLRTITGGDYYDAQDFNLEGRIAIWTDDAAAADGFEGLPLSSYDFPPTVVLRFEKRRLIDVSTEYQPYYDHQIAEVRAQLTPEALSEFRKSDGRLSSSAALTMENLHLLLRAKIKVLEIVWAYLYSGREQEAWQALAEMWPPSDLDRIRAAIQNAQAHGILREVDEVEKPSPRKPRKHHAMVYNMATRERQVSNMSTLSTMSSQMPTLVVATSNTSGGSQTPFIKEVLPQAIYLGSPEPSDKTLALPESRIYLSLVIDAAGKVQSAKLVDKADSGPVAGTLIRASKQWNFIPGYRAGRPVASQILLGVSPDQ